MGILSDDKGDETVAGAEANDTVVGGPGTDSVEAAEVVETLVSRDERCDSIDPQSGQLTAEALALRRAAAEEV
jgi:hypothetical protein